MSTKASSVADVLSVFLGIALMAISIIATGSVSRTFFTSFFCGAVCLVPYLLRRARVIELPAMLTFVIALASALHGIGLVTDAYTTLSYYDTITHTLSSTVIGLLVFYALICVQHYAGGRVNFTGRGLALFTALITLTFSVYWEVMEFSSDELTGSMTQYSPYDTLTDLVCDSVGTFIASIWAGFTMRGRTIADAVEELNINEKLRRTATGDAGDSDE